MKPAPDPSLKQAAEKGAVLCIAGLIMALFLAPPLVAWGWLFGVVYKAFRHGAGLE